MVRTIITTSTVGWLIISEEVGALRRQGWNVAIDEQMTGDVLLFWDSDTDFADAILARLRPIAAKEGHILSVRTIQRKVG